MTRASDAMASAGIRIAAVAVVALLAAVVRGWAPLVPFALVALGALYAAQLAVDDEPLDTAVPVFAAGLLLTAELAYWSLEEREGLHGERGEVPRRLALVAGLGVATLLLTATLLVVVDAVRARGLAVDLAGAAAAALVLLSIVAVATGRARRA